MYIIVYHCRQKPFKKCFILTKYFSTICGITPCIVQFKGVYCIIIIINTYITFCVNSFPAMLFKNTNTALNTLTI